MPKRLRMAYTMLMTTIAVHGINPGLMKQKFSSAYDFTPIALVCSYPMIMIARRRRPLRTERSQGFCRQAPPSIRRRRRLAEHLAGEPVVKSLNVTSRMCRTREARPSVARDHVGRSEVNLPTLPPWCRRFARRQECAPSGSRRRSAKSRLATICRSDAELGLARLSTWARGPAWSVLKGMPTTSCIRSTRPYQKCVERLRSEEALVDEAQRSAS